MAEQELSMLNRLARSVEAALQDAGISDIDNVGWSTEWDPDPELVGHAMWQLDQPEVDLGAWLGDQPARERPGETEKVIATLGEDFCGLMQASRLSIGLALLWQTTAYDDLASDNSWFWLHHTDAFLKLAVTSDRLRDLLIVACTGSSPDTFRQGSSRNRRYVTPFKEVQQHLSARGISDKRFEEAIQALPELGVSIWGYVRRRNQIVHEVATQMAKIKRAGFSDLQERFDQQQDTTFVARSDDIDTMIRNSREGERMAKKEVDDAVSNLKTWYNLLIKASHHVFETEYWSRTLGRNLSHKGRKVEMEDGP